MVAYRLVVNTKLLNFENEATSIYAKQLNKFEKESILTPLAVLALNNCRRSVVLFLYLPLVLENCLAIY